MTPSCAVQPTHPKGRDAVQTDPDTLKQGAQENLMRFNKAKCKVLHLGPRNPCYQYKLGDERMEHSPAKKYLGVLVDGSWTQASTVPSQPRKPTVSWVHPKQHCQQGQGGDHAPLHW